MKTKQNTITKTHLNFTNKIQKKLKKYLCRKKMNLKNLERKN